MKDLHPPSPFVSFALLATFASTLGAVGVAGEIPGGGPPATRADCPDPAIIEARDGSGFYIFSTGRGVPIWHSTDLKTWRRQGRVFAEPVPAWARTKVPRSRGIWAPDITFHHGRYHLYYAVSSFGSQRSVIGLAENLTLDPAAPAYRWEDRGLVIASEPDRVDFNAIDPALFVDEDGRGWLFWGSYWTGIKATEIDLATGKPAADPPVIHPIATRAPGVRPPAIEAPYVIRRSGWYYLFVSWDACCDGAKSTYKVMIGRAKSVLGPYVDFNGRPMIEGGGTLVLAGHDRWRGPGHNSVLRTGGKDYLVHHVYELDKVRVGRLLQIRPLIWLADGWPVAGEPITQPAPLAGSGAESPVGRWRHQVDYAGSATIELREDGTLRPGPAGARWTRHGRGLEMRWPAPEAPQGAWVDRVRVAGDGRSYVGRNQRGQVIRGVRLPTGSE